MTTLVTGGAGLIGMAVRSLLRARNEPVLAVDLTRHGRDDPALHEISLEETERLHALAQAEAVTADLHRATLRTPRESAPLANAFSGLALLTRVLAARTARDFTLTVDAGNVQACADQLDHWRGAAMLMAEFILERATAPAVTVALVARQAGSAVSLSVDLPAGVRVQPAFSLADALMRALEDETTDSMIIDTAGEFTALEAAAADLGGSIAVETLADGRSQRLVLLAGRAVHPPFRPQLRTVSSRPVRRAARAAA